MDKIALPHKKPNTIPSIEIRAICCCHLVKNINSLLFFTNFDCCKRTQISSTYYYNEG